MKTVNNFAQKVGNIAEQKRIMRDVRAIDVRQKRWETGKQETISKNI